MSVAAPAGRLMALATLSGHDDRVWHASWSHDGRFLATCGSDKTIRVWTEDQPGTAGATEWTCVAILEDAQTRTIRSCEWSYCGRYLAAASFDATTVIWEQAGGEFDVIATLEGHENEVKSVAWNVAGTLLATCSRDKSVWIWDADADNDFECVSVLHGHTQDVKSIRWHPSKDLLFSASYDDTVRVWAEDGDEWFCIETLKGHSATVWALAFDRTGHRLVSCSDDKTIMCWQSGDGSANDVDVSCTAG